MRIIAGAKRGMKLFGPKTDVSRPITDRVKESLFNVLYKYGIPEGKTAADVFSGVGSMGLEALSRGAASVVFVEKDPAITAVLKKNIEKAGFVNQSKVIKADAFKVGAALGFDGRKYDIIFVDPPYFLTKNTGTASPLSGLLDLLGGQTASDGLVVVRTHESTVLSERYGRLVVIERRRWGTMVITILRYSGNDK